jgi:hypothetical protein
VSATTIQKTPVAAPGWRPRASSLLTLAAAAFLATELLPWQRACVDRGTVDDPVTRCFVVHGWQGNAALIGWLAAAGAITTLVIALGARSRGRPAPTLLGIASGVVFVTGALCKWSFAQGAASTFGCWLGGVAAGVALVALVSMVRAEWNRAQGLEDVDEIATRTTHARARLVLAAVLPLIVCAGAVVPYETSGLGRWGGPLAEGFFAEGGGGGSGELARVGLDVAANGATFIRNHGGLTVTLDSVELVDATPGIRLVAVKLYACHSTDCIVGPGQAVDPNDAGFRPFEGAALPPRPARDWDLAFTPIVRLARPGPYTVAAFFVRYSVGPFRYRVFVNASEYLCGIAPGAPLSSRRCGGPLSA